MDTYKSTNTLNGKFYIGSTTNFENRKRSHLRSKENYPFQNALRKNPEAFVWEVWSDDSDEPILEQALLDTWYGKEQCYNLNPHADRPHKEAQVRGGITQGNKNAKDKTGFLSSQWLNSEEHLRHQSEAGKIGGAVTGQKHLNNGTGIFAQTKKQLSDNAKKVNSQMWVSTHDGFAGNAGNVARHNISKGWDPEDRVKVK
jgi:predicted GIY-YIG superfamily endonuclease